MHSILKSRFYFLDNPAQVNGAGFVLCAEDPFHLASIHKMKDDNDWQTWTAQNTIPWAQVGNYRVAVQYAGSLLHGRKYHLTGPSLAPVDQILQEMAGFYLAEKILTHLGYYKKFAL